MKIYDTILKIEIKRKNRSFHEAIDFKRLNLVIDQSMKLSLQK